MSDEQVFGNYDELTEYTMDEQIFIGNYDDYTTGSLDILKTNISDISNSVISNSINSFIQEQHFTVVVNPTAEDLPKILIRSIWWFIFIKLTDCPYCDEFLPIFNKLASDPILKHFRFMIITVTRDDKETEQIKVLKELATHNGGKLEIESYPTLLTFNGDKFFNKFHMNNKSDRTFEKIKKYLT
jgi:thiol-disulfide isomerase/thioredoxin